MGDAPLLIFITEWLLTYVYIRALQHTTGKGQYNNYVLSRDVVCYYLLLPLVFSPFHEHRIIDLQAISINDSLDTEFIWMYGWGYDS